MFVNIHTHFNLETKEIVNLYNLEEKDSRPSYFSFGLHPWHTNHFFDFEFFEKIVSSEKCLAIGECGLDKLKGADIKIQMKLLVKQILINRKVKKPFIIHCVKSFGELLTLKKEYANQDLWVIHDFRKTNLIDDLLKNKCKISIGKSIFHDEKIRNLVQKIDLNQLYLETDNLEIDIKTVYQEVANLRQIELSYLKKVIFENFKNDFNFNL